MLKNSGAMLYNDLMVERDYLLEQEKYADAAEIYRLVDPRGTMPGVAALCMPYMRFMNEGQQLVRDPECLEWDYEADDFVSDTTTDGTLWGDGLDLDERALEFKRIYWVESRMGTCCPDLDGNTTTDRIQSHWDVATFTEENWDNIHQSFINYQVARWWGTSLPAHVLYHPHFDFDLVGGDHEYPPVPEEELPF